MYYDVIALAAAAQCRETRQGDTTSGGRHDVLFSLKVTALDQSYFFIRHINFVRYNNIGCHILKKAITGVTQSAGNNVLLKLPSSQDLSLWLSDYVDVY